jgi:hypothetical protein
MRYSLRTLLIVLALAVVFIACSTAMFMDDRRTTIALKRLADRGATVEVHQAADIWGSCSYVIICEGENFSAGTVGNLARDLLCLPRISLVLFRHANVTTEGASALWDRLHRNSRVTIKTDAACFDFNPEN